MKFALAHRIHKEQTNIPIAGISVLCAVFLAREISRNTTRGS